MLAPHEGLEAVSAARVERVRPQGSSFATRRGTLASILVGRRRGRVGRRVHERRRWIAGLDQGIIAVCGDSTVIWS